MIRAFGSLFALVLIAALHSSCGQKDPLPKEVEYSWENGLEQWVVGYADYPAGLTTEDSLDLYAISYGYRDLPAEIQPSKKGMLTAGANRSDDLFMYLYTSVENLKPNQTYAVQISYTLASNAPTNAVGIGGAPGESVFLKAGATGKQPTLKVEEGWYRMTTDKGNQSVGGTEMIVTGNAGVADEMQGYQLITRETPAPVIATTDKSGNLWIILGSDSGYEGYTALYYTSCTIKVTPQ